MIYMLRINRKKGFSFVEIVVIIAILVVLLAVFAPMLITNVETSRMQKDDSAMDELVNAVQLAITDSETFDETYDYSIPNNYVTYSDSSGVYGQQIADEEYWAPDGSGEGVTITFNPDENGNYDLSKGIVNDMTYGNGSVAESRTAEGVKQCYFEEMGNQLLYSAVKQSVGNRLINTSATYTNSSYTVFIRFTIADGTRKAFVSGGFNGTNLSEKCQAAVGSNTSSYDELSKPITTTPSGGKQNANYSNSDLSGGGTITSIPSYKQPSNNDNPDDDTVVSNIIPIGGTYYVGVTSDQLGDYTGATETYTAGQSFPETVNDGDIYVYGDYEYRYNRYYAYSKWYADQQYHHWCVKVLDASRTSYGEILSEINGAKIVNMSCTFYNCTSLVEAPAIPNSVQNMSSTFYNCTSLTGAPSLPNGTTNMFATYYNCTSLVEAPAIPSNVQNMNYTFYNCKSLAEAPAIPSNVTDMFATFYNCTSLVIASDMSNATNVKNMNSTFNNCTSLAEAPTIPSSVQQMQDTFYNCTSLTEISVNMTKNQWNTIYRVDCLSRSNINVIHLIDGNICLSSHTGGTATCVQRAICSTCGQEYGTLASHTGGTATCIQKKVCTYCGTEYGSLGNHSGGVATCISGAICEHCGIEYGLLGSHNINTQTHTCTICGLNTANRFGGIDFTGAGTTTVYVSDTDYDYSELYKPQYSKIITFCPQVSGNYIFAASCDFDSYGALLDEITLYPEYQDDDGNGNSDFLISCYCEAGRIYYLAVGMYYSSDSGTITVTISQE